MIGNVFDGLDIQGYVINKPNAEGGDWKCTLTYAVGGSPRKVDGHGPTPIDATLDAVDRARDAIAGWWRRNA